MALTHYQNGGTLILYKTIRGSAHPGFANKSSKAQVVDLGMAFRTNDAPIGYLPFYGSRDFNLSGDTSFIEEALARLPIDLSAAASPHTLLLQQTAADLEFLGTGSPDLPDIARAVKLDLLQHAMAAASGVLVDGIMASLGGPAINAVVSQMIKSKVKQFVVSKSIGAVAKKHLKEAGRIDVDRFLSEAR
jgi:hypothetical protein